MRQWISHKYKKPAVRYELGVCIKSGNLCWIHGPFPAGSYPDITIFRHALKQQLGKYEFVEADDGYRGEPTKCLIPKNCNIFDSNEMKKVHQRARSREETIYKRNKQFHILRDTFQSHIEKHSLALRAIAVLVQLSIRRTEPLFEVQYDDLGDDV